MVGKLGRSWGGKKKRGAQKVVGGYLSTPYHTLIYG